MKSITTLFLAAGIALSPVGMVSVAIAQDKAAVAPAAPMSTGESAGESVGKSTGEIRKVDKEAGKITIRHGELKNLGMPAMTMVFRASDPAMLERLKVGDKVNFVADRVDGQFVVMQVEVQQ